MSTMDDGGPAFELGDLFKPSTRGMTLRDYFAACVLGGLAARENSKNPDEWPSFSYAVADLMLATRVAKKEAE
jgi:hypothetical protein